MEKLFGVWKFYRLRAWCSAIKIDCVGSKGGTKIGEANNCSVQCNRSFPTGFHLSQGILIVETNETFLQIINVSCSLKYANYAESTTCKHAQLLCPLPFCCSGRVVCLHIFAFHFVWRWRNADFTTHNLVLWIQVCNPNSRTICGDIYSLGEVVILKGCSKVACAKWCELHYLLSKLGGHKRKFYDAKPFYDAKLFSECTSKRGYVSVKCLFKVV